ncbi:MAG: hypothetical protein JXM79_14300 [Sedimentisphaerales bacterium]|nr:hypothetical protein [Sedimentisphaerales bacterium]
MATQAQILANRRNAQKSTGPKTAEGKAAVAKNATQHGLFARYDVVISEDPADYDALRESLLKELSPEGTMESILAERIVSLTWRIKRAARMQNEMIDVKIRKEINDSRPELSESLITGKPCDLSKYSDKCYDDQVLGYIAMRDFVGSRALERLSMYERRFEASLLRMMGELKKLQQTRKKERSEGVEMEAGSYRGRDARDTARDTARATECAKQSQFSTAQNDLNAFEKREYELLIGSAPTQNKANDSDVKPGDRGQKTDVRGRMTEDRLRRKTLVCRY